MHISDFSVTRCAQTLLVGLTYAGAALAGRVGPDAFVGAGGAPCGAPLSPAPAPLQVPNAAALYPGPNYLVQQAGFKRGNYSVIAQESAAANVPQLPVELQALNNSAGQMWQFTSDEQIQNAATPSYCLTHVTANHLPHGKIVASACTSSTAQKFAVLPNTPQGGYGPLVSLSNTSLCIEAPGYKPGTALELALCDGSAYQAFSPFSAG